MVIDEMEGDYALQKIKVDLEAKPTS